MPNVEADIPSGQAGADNALTIAEGLKGMSQDFKTICDEADSMFSGEPAVDGMPEFQSEYQHYMDSVQSQANDISDNIYSSASIIGNTDADNMENIELM
ncbi:hypothetical protein [Nocardiopsis oceani]